MEIAGKLSGDVINNSEILTSINLILSIDEIFSETYFYHFTEEINYLSTKTKKNKTEIKEIFNSYLDGLIYSLSERNAEHKYVINAEVLELLLHPILNNFKLNKKTYKDFNINISFFENLRNSNSEAVESSDQILILSDFKFLKNKLNKFKLYNPDYNVSYEYDKNYEQTNILFPDNTSLKIPKEIGKKDGKKGKN